MSIPKYYEFFSPVMVCLKDGKQHTSKETLDYYADYYKLTPDELNEKLQSGQTILSNRVGWARTLSPFRPFRVVVTFIIVRLLRFIPLVNKLI